MPPPPTRSGLALLAVACVALLVLSARLVLPRLYWQGATPSGGGGDGWGGVEQEVGALKVGAPAPEFGSVLSGSPTHPAQGEARRAEARLKGIRALLERRRGRPGPVGSPEPAGNASRRPPPAPSLAGLQAREQTEVAQPQPAGEAPPILPPPARGGRAGGGNLVLTVASVLKGRRSYAKRAVGGTDIERYLASLRATGCTADVVLLTQDPYPPSLERTVRAYCAEVVVTSQWARSHGGLEFEGNPLRHVWYLQFLRARGAPYARILVTDVRDVAFQSDPFRHPFAAPGSPMVLFADASVPATDTEWFRRNALRCYDRGLVRRTVRRSPPLCGGLVMGAPDDLIRLEDGLLGQMRGAFEAREDCPRTFDQHHLTMFAYARRAGLGFQLHLNDDSMSLARNLGVENVHPVRTTSSGDVADREGRAYAVVHQFDRRPDLRDRWAARTRALAARRPSRCAADASRDPRPDQPPGENEDGGARRGGGFPRAEAEEPVPVGGAAGPRVYVYDLGDVNDRILAENRWWAANDHTQAQQFITEWVVHSNLKESPARVERPEEADLFFVPFYGSLFAGRDPSPPLLEELRARVRSTVISARWFRRRGGRDHTLVYGSTRNVRQMAGSLWPALRACMLLAIEAKDGRGGGLPFRRQKDLVVPYFVPVLPEDEAAPLRPRPTRVFFWGTWNRRSGGLRERLVRMFAGDPGNDVRMTSGYVNARDPTGDGIAPPVRDRPALLRRERGLITATREAMRRATFCLCPRGRTPTSRRFFEAVAAKCLPVVISDRWLLPFEAHDPGIAGFAVRVKEADVGGLKRALDAMPPAELRSRQDLLLANRPRFLFHYPDAQPGDAFHELLRGMAARRKELGID